MAELGAALRDVGFTEDRLREVIGAPSSRTTPVSITVALRRLGDDALAGAIRFWYLGLDLSAAQAETLFGSLASTDLAFAGLVELAEDRVVPSVRIAPMGELLVAHDFDRGDPLSADHVLGVGAATRTLAALTPRGRVERTLDIGTGNGIQALLAAGHSDLVVATDLSERAAMMARLNAVLGGRSNIEVRVGDGFEPVAGEHFDLVVSNPPFVVSPDRTLTFRDSAAEGDQMSRSTVRGAAEHLRGGGTACVLANWMVRSRDSELAAPAGWVADLDCDSLILHHETLDPVSYAERWTFASAHGGPESFSETLDRWLRYYNEVGVVGIASGAIILRKTCERARFRVLRMAGRPADGGAHVERILSAIGHFSGPDDAALAAARLRLAEPHDLRQHVVFEGGAYRAREATLRLRRSAGVEVHVPADLLEALFLVDGERSLGGLLDEVATARGASPASLRVHALPVFLRLYECGYLESDEQR